MRRNIIEKCVNIDRNNFFQLKFLINEEIERVKNRLLNYKKRGIIDRNSKIPRVLVKRYKKKVQGLIKSRKSLYSAKNLLIKVR